MDDLLPHPREPKTYLFFEWKNIKVPFPLMLMLGFL